jgi:ATP-binding cassette subfamily F protein uup
LSTGQKRRVLLAGALATDPDLLILDEPTNHLDIPAIRRLEALLLRRHGSLLFVTHDRELLRRLAGRILELDRGVLRDWNCDYDTFLRRREEDLAAEQKRRAEFDRRLAEEEVWVRQGVRERRTRNEGRVRRLLAMREERSQRRDRLGAADFDLAGAERSGRLVLRAEGASVGYGGPPVISDLDCTILRGDRVGIVGPNGSGKTTLLRLLLGELSPATGSIRRGTNLETVYFDQRREQLDPLRSVQDNVADGNDHVVVDGRQIHVLTWLQRFLFTPDRARSPLTRLSGGERNRLLLARLFTRPANLLVLDEPTNDLDLETLELLEELLGEFTGTLLLVSHDRAFLENVVTSTLVLDGSGRVVESAGGWQDWERLEAAVAARSVVVKLPTTEPRPRRERARRLSFKERSELAVLPAQIEALEAERAASHARLADPELYKASGDAVPRLREALAAQEAALEQAYARWAELEAVSENE